MPIYPSADDILIYEGICFKAEWYYTSEGKMPAHEYYLRSRCGSPQAPRGREVLLR